MIVRSKAPLRLGLAGGGTDVSPYCDEYGGCILNATIDMYAYCTIERINDNLIIFQAEDLQQSYSHQLQSSLSLKGDLILHKAIYNRVVKDFNGGAPLSIKVTTYSDAPPGSGLGSSSTMVVAILAAYRTLLNLPLGEYELAMLAYQIERIDCSLSGGRQDQYAATFGGFNFMEFYADNQVIVNPLRIRNYIINELQSYLMLYYSGASRDSAKIIDEQILATRKQDRAAIEAMHDVKSTTKAMKECLLRSDIAGMIEVVQKAWEAKKRMSKAISNQVVEQFEKAAEAAGVNAFRVSGAGGGGYMMLFVDPTRRLAIMRDMVNLGGGFQRFQFTQHGVQSWVV